MWEFHLLLDCDNDIVVPDPHNSWTQHIHQHLTDVTAEQAGTDDK